MLHIAATALSDYVSYIPHAIFFLFVVIAVRRYAAGYVYRPAESSRRTLAGKTFVLTDALGTGSGTSLVQEMANLGAQLILLHPDPSASARVMQLVMLVRSSTHNERIYVEQCDLRSLRSIDAFADGWKKRARAGAVGDLEARIDGIVFLTPAPSPASGFGNAKMTVDPVLRSAAASESTTKNDPVEQNDWSYVGSRLALINALEDTIVKSAKTSPVKVVAQVSPFYAAALPDADDLDWTKRAYPTRQPWLAEGQASLAWLSCSRKLQGRFDERNKASGTTGAGVAFLNVCEGFTRSWANAVVARSRLMPVWLRIAIQIATFPLVWLACKSSSDAIQTTLACLLEPLARQDDVASFLRRQQSSTPSSEVQHDHAKKKAEDEAVIELRGGVLYREGKPTRVALLESAPAEFEKKLFTKQESRLRLMRSETRETDSQLKQQLEERLRKAKEKESASTTTTTTT